MDAFRMIRGGMCGWMGVEEGDIFILYTFMSAYSSVSMARKFILGARVCVLCAHCMRPKYWLVFVWNFHLSPHTRSRIHSAVPLFHFSLFSSIHYMLAKHLFNVKLFKISCKLSFLSYLCQSSERLVCVWESVKKCLLVSFHEPPRLYSTLIPSYSWRRERLFDHKYLVIKFIRSKRGVEGG